MFSHVVSLSQDLVAWVNEIYRLGLDAMQPHRNNKFMPASPCQRCIVSRDDNWGERKWNDSCEAAHYHAGCWIHAPLSSFLFVSFRYTLVVTLLRLRYCNSRLNFNPLSIVSFRFLPFSLLVVIFINVIFIFIESTPKSRHLLN